MAEIREKCIDPSLRALDMKEMGRRIKERRVVLEISREKLGNRLGVTQQFIADIEYGKKGMSLQKLYAMCQILGVTADYILAGERLDENDEEDLMRAREKVMDILCRCDADQLRGIGKIAQIYSEGIRMD
ncbi:MAG: helix-turn-helix transcriptional regulator [Firmicutes bacterium]|nr:helix-turn-helix transcriptional regulator [Bacillota bacterium]